MEGTIGFLGAASFTFAAAAVAAFFAAAAAAPDPFGGAVHNNRIPCDVPSRTKRSGTNAIVIGVIADLGNVVN